MNSRASTTTADTLAVPPLAGSAEEAGRRRLSLRPLLALKPLILAHKGALAAAIVALVASALAMLAVPEAVRRMIDRGFGANDSALINNYFLSLIGIGLIIAVASPARY
jgi:ATP-binding cassette subfamily B protein